MNRSLARSALLLFSGCAVHSGNLEPTDEPAKDAGAPADARPSVTRAATLADEEELCRAGPGESRREIVCHRWRCEGAGGVAPARWSGDASRCDAGDLDADAGARALRVLNLHRFLAGVAPVEAEAAWIGPAQTCALVAHANKELSHTPAPDWRCWSEVAALTSSVSLIANRSAPLAIAAFIEDPGNEATMVHRRWLLSEELTRVGVGSTDRYACVVVDGAALGAPAHAKEPKEPKEPARPSPRGWVAWPPEGPVPMDVFASERLDEIGWTVQSPSDDLDHATVTVSSQGAALPIRMTRLAPRLGSRSAIRFVPDGWSTEAGRSYVVRVTGARTFDFTVEPIDCADGR